MAPTALLHVRARNGRAIEHNFGVRRLLLTEMQRVPYPELTIARARSARSIAAAPTLSRYLDQLLRSRWLSVISTHRVCDPAELPPRLERRVRSLPDSCVWRAYTDESRLWCAIATALDSPSDASSLITLKVVFFGDNAELCSGGIWTCSPAGEWHLHEPVDSQMEAARNAFDAVAETRPNRSGDH
jgi:hypothetical protein